MLMNEDSQDLDLDSEDSIDFASEEFNDDAMEVTLDSADDEDLQTPVTPGFEQDKLTKARAKLALSARPEKLPCRESEIERIYDAVNKAVTLGSPLTMYIAGEPGTGKTACVTKVINRIQQEHDPKDVKYAFINAMKLSAPSEAYTKLHEQIYKTNKRTKKYTKKEQHKRLNDLFTKAKGGRPKPYTVVVIDELDFLVTRAQKEIYEFFNWPQYEHSKLAIIGIANTVALPEQLLAKIANRFQQTERIVFSTYSKSDIIKILNDRVQSLHAFEPRAIELCAAKVASSSGDIRRCLDVCRRAAEMVGHGKTVTAGDITDAYNDLLMNGMYPILEMSIYHKLFFLTAIREQHNMQTNDLSFEKIVGRMQTLIDMCPTKNLIAKVSIRELLPICDCLDAMNIITVTRSEAERYPIIRLNIEKEVVIEKFRQDPEMEVFINNK
jgi:origin recognition complex subunit 1